MCLLLERLFFLRNYWNDFFSQLQAIVRHKNQKTWGTWKKDVLVDDDDYMLTLRDSDDNWTLNASYDKDDNTHSQYMIHTNTYVGHMPGILYAAIT